MPEIEHLLHTQNQLGEGPLWHPEQQALYWVDIYQRKVERYHPASQLRREWHFDTAITALGVQGGGGFVVATAAGLGFWDGLSEAVEILASPEASKPHNRFNDGAVDPAGCFWAGTMYDGPESQSPEEGRLYRLGPDLRLATMETGLTISNGMGWSPDGRTMYFTDTLRLAIYAYDYDMATASIANRRVLVDTSGEAGYPDGLAVDSQGFIWSARWGGWKVARYDPDGKKEREITLPVEFPTSCAFGGENLEALYITSAWTALDQAGRKAQPLAGDLFRVNVGLRGLPANRFG